MTSCGVYIADYVQTTGHTLAYALALLALYPDEQEKFNQHARKIFKEDEMPVRTHLVLLTQDLSFSQST